MTCTTDSSLAVGAQSVVVTNPLGLTATSTFTVVALAPTISYANATGTIGTVFTTLSPSPFSNNGSAITNCVATVSAPTTAGYPAVNPTALPAGLTLNTTTCAISGTPTGGVLGVYNLTVTATNSIGSTTSNAFTITISPSCSNTTGFAGGQGTFVSPYLICNSAQVIMVGANSTNLGAFYQLTSNVDMANIAFAPLGIFTGSFNGQNYSLQNLSIRSNATNVGFISQLNGGSVQNLYFQNVSINVTGSYSNVGVFGYVYGTATSLQNIILNNITVTASGSSNVGAAIGYLYVSGASTNINISQVCVTGTSSVTGSSYVGGFLGQINGTTSGTLSKSCTNATVVGSSTVGGFAGWLYQGLTVSNSYSTGSVTGTSTVGGFAGGIITTVNNSFSTGAISNSGSSTQGGFSADYNGTTNNCLYNNTVTSLTDRQVTGLDTTDMQFEANFLNWNFDFENTWIMPATTGYPVFQWMYPALVTARSPDFAGGSGVNGDPYQITTAAQFNAISRNPTVYGSKYFILNNPIDFSSAGAGNGGVQQPIAWVGSNTPFTGNFNGNGKTISGVSITSSQAAGRNNVGVFSQMTTNATISNLYLSGITINAPAATGVGGLIGSIYTAVNPGNMSISQVCIIGTSSITGGTNVGGVVGQSQGTVNGGTISKSCSYASVIGSSMVGGFAGWLYQGLTVNNSYSSGPVTGTSNVGGFAGGMVTTTTNSFSTGTISNSGSSTQGGFAADYNGTTNNCLYNNTVTSLTDRQVTGLDTTDMQFEANFLNWNYDFENTWIMPATTGYPVLQWMYPALVTARSPDFAGGTGVNGDPYQITTAAQFNAIARNPTTYGSKYFILNNSIDFSSAGAGNGGVQQPIAWIGANTPFTGNFNGNGKTISGVSITSLEAAGRNNVGIFSQITNGASIQNLYISGITINAPASSLVGGLVGSIYTASNPGNMSISKVCIIGTSSITGGSYVGGLIGESTGTVNGGAISKSCSYATVIGGSTVGGFAGWLYQGLTVNDSYSSGPVTGTSVVGGFAGGLITTVTNSFSTGTISNSGSSTQGGFAADYNGTTNNCLYNNTVTTLTDRQVTGLDTTDMQFEANYLNWNFDFESTWIMPATTGYPVLQWMYPALVTARSPDFAGGSGVNGDPYQITSVAQFNAISRNAATYASKYFILNNSIDFSSAGAGNGGVQQPIAWVGSNTPFTGNFNGNGKTISGVNITSLQAAGRNNVGVFSQLTTNGTIQNLLIDGITINAPAATSVGGVVGYIYTSVNPGNMSISQVCVTGASSITGGSDVGGVVGQSTGTTNGGIITKSCSYATVTGGTNVGGFAGWLYQGLTVNNCYTQGSVTGTSTVGGFVGGMITTTTNSYSTSTINNNGSNTKGGFSPDYNGGTGNCLYNNQNTSLGDNQVTGYSTTSMQTQSVYTSLSYNFSTIWHMGSGYPTFIWMQ
jgi:hypothetical protein